MQMKRMKIEDINGDEYVKKFEERRNYIVEKILMYCVK